MKTVAVILARLSCTRLPQKALLDMAGQPMLQYTVERVRLCRLVDEVLLATSDDDTDAPLAEFAAQIGLSVFRGSLTDVVGRFLGAAVQTDADKVLRVNGDSPWVDPDLLDRAIGALDGFDLVTNIQPRTYPAGISVEAMWTAALRRAHGQISKAADREHVTRYFYQHPEKFRILNVESGRAWGDLHMAVDTPTDFEMARRVAGLMNRPHWEYSTEEIVRLHGQVEED